MSAVPIFIQTTDALPEGLGGFSDLTAPEARDRVLRVLGAQVGLDVFCCPMLEVVCRRGHPMMVMLTSATGRKRRWFACAVVGLADISPGGDEAGWTLSLQALWNHLNPPVQP